MPNIKINHIKVPEFQIGANGNEIIKAKKIQVNPISNQTRSLSAQCNFRKVFQVPRSSQNKENFVKVSTSVKAVGKLEDERRFRSQCRGADQTFEKRVRESWVKRSEICENKDQGEKVVPKIKLLNIGLECLKRAGKRNQEDLVTFRPGPIRKETKFPRDVFSIEGRKKLGVIINNE